MRRYFTYILESQKNRRYYIGHCNNTSDRLKCHNSGKNKSTKPYRPWVYVYTKKFSTRSEAIKYEKYLKSLKSRDSLKKIINAG